MHSRAVDSICFGIDVNRMPGEENPLIPPFSKGGRGGIFASQANRGDLTLALIAALLFVPLFIFRSVGPFDFFWWMSINITALIVLGNLSDKSYFPSVLSDMRSRPVWKIGVGVLAAILLYGIFFAGHWLSRHILPFAGPDISRVYGFKEGASTLRVILLMTLLIGPGEEYFWRGFLQRRFQTRFGRGAGWLLSSTLYAFVHAGSGNTMLVLAAAVCGLFWGFLYLRLRSVLLVAVSHTLWDLLVFVVVSFQ